MNMKDGAAESPGEVRPWQPFAVTPSDTLSACIDSMEETCAPFVLVADEGRFIQAVDRSTLAAWLAAGAGLTDPVAAHLDAAHVVSDPVDMTAPGWSLRCTSAGNLEEIIYTPAARTYAVSEPVIGMPEIRQVLSTVASGWVSSSGGHVTAFEEQFANFCDVPYGIATCNGTCSLHLLLSGLGIGFGDEVIVPALTFGATANAVAVTGARPVFVDSDAESWNISVEAVEAAITTETRAIIPVHLYGCPADMVRLEELSAAYNLFLIEDAAEAHGARCAGRRVGSFGTAASFSFYGNKLITTGEGGMVVTRDEGLSERLRVLRDHGMAPTRRYWHEEVGFNYRMTNVQAALGCAQVERLELLLARKREIGFLYRKYLADDRIRFQKIIPDTESIFWLNSVELTCSESQREEVVHAMANIGIDTRRVFPPLHQQPAFAQVPQTLPIAESLGQQGISLPSSVQLGDADVRYIAGRLLDVLDTLGI